MNKKNLTILFTLLFTLVVDYGLAQTRPSENNNSMIRQYTFSALPVVDANSDSIRVLSYLVVPNNVLKFVKKSGSFESAYQAKITLKKKKGDQVGRKTWSNT